MTVVRRDLYIPAMETDLSSLYREFERVFGGAPAEGGDSRRWRLHVVRAPGRVNLIGEHTDYNDGFVFPMAIEPQVTMICRARNDSLVRLASTAFSDGIVEFAINRPVTRGRPAWADYSRGVAAELIAAGIPLSGMDALIANTLPVGGGLSSSAAIEVATALSLLSVADTPEMDRGRLVMLCRKAEHEFAGVPVGIMDQTAVAMSQAGSAMLLDCRDLSKRFVPIDSRDVRVVIANTMVRHELTGGEYARRRAECEQGVAWFAERYPGIRALRDVTPAQLEEAAGKLPDVVFRRCRHVIGENARTVEAAEALPVRDYERMGELMVRSHQSLRDDYEVSCPELDFLVEEAVGVKGVYGARMTGGGFGGCIVALVQPRRAEALADHLVRTYESRFKIRPTVFATTATAAAGVIE